MPYNNTPIAPSAEITGTVSLPLARVKKIISQDDDISNCSNNAAFVITVATEMFLQHLVEQSHNIVKSERKPRRNIQYRDVANAVARVENLEFLTDVVPKTQTYKQYKQKQANKPAVPHQANGLAKGQTTLGNRPIAEEEQQATNAAYHDAMELDEVIEPNYTGTPAGRGANGNDDEVSYYDYNAHDKENIPPKNIGFRLHGQNAIDYTDLHRRKPAHILGRAHRSPLGARSTSRASSHPAARPIDLLETPEGWIIGYDAGFTSRPFGWGNSDDYVDGYRNGAHEAGRETRAVHPINKLQEAFSIFEDHPDGASSIKSVTESTCLPQKRFTLQSKPSSTVGKTFNGNINSPGALQEKRVCQVFAAHQSSDSDSIITADSLRPASLSLSLGTFREAYSVHQSAPGIIASSDHNACPYETPPAVYWTPINLPLRALASSASAIDESNTPSEDLSPSALPVDVTSVESSSSRLSEYVRCMSSSPDQSRAASRSLTPAKPGIIKEPPVVHARNPQSRTPKFVWKPKSFRRWLWTAAELKLLAEERLKGTAHAAISAKIKETYGRNRSQVACRLMWMHVRRISGESPTAVDEVPRGQAKRTALRKRASPPRSARPSLKHVNALGSRATLHVLDGHNVQQPLRPSRTATRRRRTGTRGIAGRRKDTDAALQALRLAL